MARRLGGVSFVFGLLLVSILAARSVMAESASTSQEGDGLLDAAGVDFRSQEHNVAQPPSEGSNCT